MKRISICLMFLMFLSGFLFSRDFTVPADFVASYNYEVVGDGTNYYGYTYFYDNANFIAKHVVSGSTTTITYAASYSDHDTNWTNKDSLNYYEWGTSWSGTNIN